MSDIIIKDVLNPRLLNGNNQVFVTVNLEEWWEEIKLQPYIMVFAEVEVPIREEEKHKTILIKLTKEYKSLDLMDTKTVELVFDVVEQIDREREAFASASFLSYQKQ